jgi:hypothetical protein
MAAILTTVALQLKGTLVFFLGLAGLFTTAKALVTSVLTTPTFRKARPEVRVPADRLRSKLVLLAIASVCLFAAALGLYFFSPLATIDADALRRTGAQIDIPQQRAVAALIAIAIFMVIVEVGSIVVRHRLGKFDSDKN